MMQYGWSGRHSFPGSSSLMKFTIRVVKMPSESSTTTSSPRTPNVRPGCLRRNSSDRDDDADERAVERHPALPDRDEVQRVREVVAQVVLRDDVGDHEAGPPADQHADQRVDQEVLDLVGGEPQPPPARRPVHPQKDADEPEQVREPVPVHGDRPEVERDRVDVRIGEPVAHSAVVTARGSRALRVRGKQDDPAQLRRRHRGVPRRGQGAV